MNENESESAKKENYSQSILNYERNSTAEKKSAKRLADSLEPWLYSVPDGPILETGCGTGGFTRHLVQLFPSRELIITDRSEEMVSYTRHQIGTKSNLSFKQLDIEKKPPGEGEYSLICGNHIAHQFQQSALVLEQLAKSLTIDGLMLMAFPGEDSFPEWRSSCVDLGIPYTGKPLPDTEQLVIHLSMGPVQVDFYEDQSKVRYENLNSFFQHLKNGGLQIQEEGKQLSEKEINLLNNHWKDRKDGKIRVTYHNVFLAVKKIG